MFKLAPKLPPGFGANGRRSQRRAEGGQGTDSTTHLALKLVRHSVGGLVAAQGPSAPFEGFSGQVFIAQLVRLDHRLVRRPKFGAMIPSRPAACKCSPELPRAGSAFGYVTRFSILAVCWWRARILTDERG